MKTKKQGDEALLHFGARAYDSTRFRHWFICIHSAKQYITPKFHFHTLNQIYRAILLRFNKETLNWSAKINESILGERDNQVSAMAANLATSAGFSEEAKLSDPLPPFPSSPLSVIGIWGAASERDLHRSSEGEAEAIEGEGELGLGFWRGVRWRRRRVLQRSRGRRSDLNAMILRRVEQGEREREWVREGWESNSC